MRDQRSEFAMICMSHADPGMEGGRTFSTEVGRQAKIMAAYLDSSGGQLSSSLTDADKEAMDTAARDAAIPGSAEYRSCAVLRFVEFDPVSGNP